MPSLTYQQTTEKDIEDRIRKRFRAELAALEKMGFSVLCFCEELSFPYGLFVYLVALPLMLVRRQVLKIKSPLRVALYDPVLISKEHATYASLSGLGVTFQTNFTDGTLLVSKHTGLHVPDLTDEKIKYYHYPSAANMESAWSSHQARLNELTLAGKQIKESLSFEDYLETSQRGEAIVGQAMVTGKLYEPRQRRESAKPNKLFAIFMLCVVAMMVLALIAATSELSRLLQVESYRGVGTILAIGVVCLNFVVTTLDAFRGRAFGFDDIFYIPGSAIWLKRVGSFLLGLALVTLVLGYLNVLPKGSFFTVAAIWWTYQNGASLFCKLRRPSSLAVRG